MLAGRGHGARAAQLARLALLACSSFAAVAQVADTSSPCSDNVIIHTEVSSGGKAMSQATAHIAAAIRSNLSWFRLTKGSNPWVVEQGSINSARAWYDSPRFKPNNCEGRVNGSNCDEYPPLATKEGGPRSAIGVNRIGPSFPSLLPIDGSHNKRSGATFGAFYKSCNLESKGFFVVPVQSSGPGVGPLDLARLPSFWLCG